MHRQRKKLSNEQVNELQVGQDKSPDAASVMRFQAVRLYGRGYAVATIQTICRCSRPSLLEWNRKYHQGGMAALLDQRQGGNRALLSQEAQEALQRTLQCAINESAVIVSYSISATSPINAPAITICRGASNA